MSHCFLEAVRALKQMYNGCNFKIRFNVFLHGGLRVFLTVVSSSCAILVCLWPGLWSRALGWKTPPSILRARSQQKSPDKQTVAAQTSADIRTFRWFASAKWTPNLRRICYHSRTHTTTTLWGQLIEKPLRLCPSRQLSPAHSRLMDRETLCLGFVDCWTGRIHLLPEPRTKGTEFQSNTFKIDDQKDSFAKCEPNSSAHCTRLDITGLSPTRRFDHYARHRDRQKEKHFNQPHKTACRTIISSSLQVSLNVKMGK